MNKYLFYFYHTLYSIVESVLIVYGIICKILNTFLISEDMHSHQAVHASPRTIFKNLDLITLHFKNTGT